MGFISKKEKFKSKIPDEYRSLTLYSITNDIADKVLSEFPEITIPKFIEKELEKGNITKDKADELKCKAVIHGIKDYIKKEEEEFDRSRSVKNKLKTYKSKVYKPETHEIKKYKLSVYESECNGIISKEEVDFLIDALKQ